MSNLFAYFMLNRTFTKCRKYIKFIPQMVTYLMCYFQGTHRYKPIGCSYNNPKTKTACYVYKQGLSCWQVLVCLPDNQLAGYLQWDQARLLVFLPLGPSPVIMLITIIGQFFKFFPSQPLPIYTSYIVKQKSLLFLTCIPVAFHCVFAHATVSLCVLQWPSQVFLPSGWVSSLPFETFIIIYLSIYQSLVVRLLFFFLFLSVNYLRYLLFSIYS